MDPLISLFQKKLVRLKHWTERNDDVHLFGKVRIRRTQRLLWFSDRSYAGTDAGTEGKNSTKGKEENNYEFIYAHIAGGKS